VLYRSSDEARRATIAVSGGSLGCEARVSRAMELCSRVWPRIAVSSCVPTHAFCGPGRRPARPRLAGSRLSHRAEIKRGPRSEAVLLDRDKLGCLRPATTAISDSCRQPLHLIWQDRARSVSTTHLAAANLSPRRPPGADGAPRRWDGYRKPMPAVRLLPLGLANSSVSALSRSHCGFSGSVRLTTDRNNTDRRRTERQR